MKKCIYSGIGAECNGNLFPTNIQGNVICDKHRRQFSAASWEYVAKLEAEADEAERLEEELKIVRSEWKEDSKSLKRMLLVVRASYADLLKLEEQTSRQSDEFAARVKKLEEGWPELGDELLGLIEAEIIVRTGDGPLAGYVVRWLDRGNKE